MLDLGVDVNVWPWVWLFIAVTFTLIEVTLLGGSFVLLPFAVSAFAAAVMGFYDVPVEGQWAVFVFGGGVMWIGFYRWARTFLRENALPPGVGADRLIGMIGVVIVAIAPHDVARAGRISVAGETWGADTANDVALPAGTPVRIARVLGTRVVVEAFEQESDSTEGPL